MGVLSWCGLVIPKFLAPPSGKTMCQTPKVFEVQERARGPLSPCQVWWGTDFTRRLSVCLSVCPSRFSTSEIVHQISSRRRWSIRGFAHAAGFAAARRCLRFLVLSACLFVCLSITLLNVRVVRPISPWRRWSTETILKPLDMERFVVVHLCSTFSDCC